MSAQLKSLPKGFAPMEPRGEFTVLTGPFYYNFTDPSLYGFLPVKSHSNKLGFVHGGMIATFCDSAMAQCVENKFKSKLVTLDISLNYKNLVATGRWAEAIVEIETINEEEVLAKARVMSRGMSCARATARYKLLTPQPNSKNEKV